MMKKNFTLLFILVLVSGVLAAQAPVFYLTFDHMDDDDVEVHDVMNGLIGTASGEIVSGGQYGDAFSMNGTDGFIHIEDTVINRGTFTLTTWFSMLSFEGEDPALFQTDGDEGGGAVFILVYDEGMECFANNTGGEQAYWAEAAPPLEDWMHFAMVVDIEAETVKLYADGEEVGSETGTWFDEEDKPLIGPFSIGAHTEDGLAYSRNLNVIVDEFRLYDVALTAEEVVASMEEYEDLGIKSREMHSVRVFPNPTSGMFTLDKDLNSIRIFNISGQEVMSIEEYRAFSQIDAAFLSKGLFLLKTDSGGTESTVKLVIR
jgi:hypothetical protein